MRRLCDACVRSVEESGASSKRTRGESRASTKGVTIITTFPVITVDAMATSVTFIPTFSHRLPCGTQRVLPVTKKLRRRGRPVFLSAAGTPPPVAKVSAGSVPFQVGRFQLQVSGRLVLSVVPILWGSFVPVAKLLYRLPRAFSPATFNTLRLIVSTVFFLPYLRPKYGTKHFRAGAELGMLIFFANACQIIGLKYTHASRAAFLNQLSTVFVPLAAVLLGIDRFTSRLALGAVLALAGVGFLTLGGGGGMVSLLGDAFEIVSACFTTLYVLRVGQVAKKFESNSMPLVAVKVLVQTLLSITWLLAGVGRTVGNGVVQTLTPWTPGLMAINVILVLWGGIGVSAASSWLQTKGQMAVPPSEAAILYAAQPLWASLLAAILLGERFSWAGGVGAALIVSGAIVSSGVKGKKKR